MNLARFSVNRPIAASIISVTIFILGIYYLGKMPVSLYPEVTAPFVSVVIPLPGATPEQIEQKIVVPLEKELSAIKGQKRVFAMIRQGVATMVIGFRMNIEQNEAVNSVRERVAKVKATFPKDTREPIVSRVDLGATPILIYGIDSQRSAAATKNLLDNVLVRELQTTSGVSEAEVVGLGEEQVEIALDPERMAALRIAPLDVFQQIATYVTTIPWGDIQKGSVTLKVSRAMIPQDPDYWSNYLLTLSDGRAVRLNEIAQVKSAYDTDAAMVRINGKPGLSLVVKKRADANVIESVSAVKQVIDKLDPSLGIKLFSMVDQSHHIEENAHEVWIALFLGGIFAVLVILVFLTDVKSALITATALPVSVAGTFIFIHYFGFSVNMMSLLALSLAIGLLIDDAVVVREAIFSQIEEGVSAREAAVKGTDKVASAVLATTLAVVAVFLPISLLEGVVGQFFKEFGGTIVIAVLISLWVAFTLDPMLSSKFAGKHRPLRGAIWDRWRAWLSELEQKTGRLAAKAFKNPLPVVVISIVLLASSIFLVMLRGADFLSLEDRANLLVTLLAKEGSSREKTLALADSVYQRLIGMEGLVDVYAEVSGTDETRCEMRLVFTPKNQRDRNIVALSDEVKKRLEGLEAEHLIYTPPFVEGAGMETQLSFYIYGDDLDQLYAQVDRFLPELRTIPGVANIILDTPRKAPGFDVALNQNQVSYYNTNSTAIELTGRLALTGLEAGAVGAENLSLWLRYPASQRNILALWDRTYVPTPRGPVLLSALATASSKAIATTINREKRSRKVVLHGAMDSTRSYANILKDVATVLNKLPPPMRYDIAGDKEYFDEMTTSFTIAIIGSVFFIFVILSIQFENILRPFVILLTLPLAIIGGFFSLYISCSNLTLGSLIGVIFLIGLAAKNGILLVDAVGVKEKVMSLAEAVRLSTMERFRPIIMTSVTMLFGMLPTALMRGGGSETRAPMAIVIIGGVVSSTLLSLVIVPAIFGLMARFGAREKHGIHQSGLRKKGGFRRGKNMAALFLAGIVTGMAAPSAKLIASEGYDIPLADMHRLTPILDAPPQSGSQEKFLTDAAHESAVGLTQSSLLAFAGGLKLEAKRQWANPGVINEVTVPLPPVMGGPVSVKTTVLPKQEDIYSIGWTIPVFNYQAIRSLAVASLSREQEKVITLLEHENYAREKSALILAYELALKTKRVQKERVEIAAARLATVKAKVAAGLARLSTQDEAEASLAAAKADVELAGTEVVRVRFAFRAKGGQELPDEGFGLPQFPLVLDAPFNPLGIKALKSVALIQESSAQVYDAAFVPSIDLTLARQIQKYEPDGPEPQNVVGLSVSWLLLDGGTRRRNVSDSKRKMLEARAEAAGMETELRTAYDTLKTREEGARFALKAAESGLRAASQAVGDALNAFNSGSGRLLDIRIADEARLNAALGLYKAKLGLQAIAVESLVLSGNFLNYLAKEKL